MIIRMVIIYNTMYRVNDNNSNKYDGIFFEELNE